MAVQQNKKTRSRRDMRRSHDALKNKQTVLDRERGELFVPHNVSPNGFYRGKQLASFKQKEIEAVKQDAEQEES